MEFTIDLFFLMSPYLQGSRESKHTIKIKFSSLKYNDDLNH